MGFYPPPMHPVVTMQSASGPGLVTALVIGLVALMLIDGYAAFHYTSIKQ
jgi:hypothetical protein